MSNKMKCSKRTTFHFTKLFIKETPAFQPGDTYEDTIDFVARESFDEWVRNINESTTLPYRVTNVGRG